MARQSSAIWVLAILLGGFLTVGDVGAASEPPSFVLEPQNGQWHLRVITETATTLPEIVKEMSFATRDEATEFIKRHYGVKRSEIFRATSPHAAIFKTEVSNRVIWPTTQEWSWQWEEKYAQWMSSEVEYDFLYNHQISTDCADVPLALRWIFSRIHGLPAANVVAGTKTLFTNESMKSHWKKLSAGGDWHKDARFLAALDYLLEMTNAQSLRADSYPVAINPQGLLPGAFLVHIGRDWHHTQLVFRQHASEPNQLPLYTAESTTPRTIRGLVVTGYKPYFTKLAEDSSFRRHLWPAKGLLGWRLVEAEKMPQYSLEQFQPEYSSVEAPLAITIMKKINPDFDAALILSDTVQSVEKLLQQRITIVQQGFEYCQANDCAEGTPGYDAWSTPARDARIENLFWDLDKTVDYFRNIGIFSGWSELHDLLQSKTLRVCDYDHTLYTLKSAWRPYYFSHLPSDPIAKRWGCEYLDRNKN